MGSQFDTDSASQSNSSYDDMYDCVIIGGGPSGLTAAIYLARARYRVLVLEQEHFGGQITITNEVVNYPGVFKASGKEITATMQKQAQSFGAEFMLAKAEKLDIDGDIKVVHTDKGDLKCFAILLATGAHPRMIGFKGESSYRGRGVAYCATCDGEFFTGKRVYVIGGGFAAAEESVFLTKYASEVIMLIREDDFTCAKAVADETKNNKDITIFYHTEVEEVRGENGLNYIKYKDIKSGEETVYEAPAGDSFGVFVFAGYVPATDLVKNLIELNPQGYIITDKNQMTNIPGVFASGDVCVKDLRQVVTATGDAALAATEIEKYARSKQKDTGIIPPLKITRVAVDDSAKKSESNSSSNTSELFDDDQKAQLKDVFGRLESKLELCFYGNGNTVSKELKDYLDELAKLSDNLIIITDKYDVPPENQLPAVKIFKDGIYTGLAFHGVPGGHEFTSFVLGIYNVGSKGQPISEDTKNSVLSIKDEKNIRVLVSLSCKICPEVVLNAQRIASLNPLVTAEVYDLKHFEYLKDKFQVMSVPCILIGSDDSPYVDFGKKSIDELVELLQSH